MRIWVGIILGMTASLFLAGCDSTPVPISDSAAPLVMTTPSKIHIEGETL